MNDVRWVRRILRGDKGAGERWVAEFYPAVQRMLWYLTRDQEVAADLTQQTFVKAWQSLESFRGEARLSTWVRRIAYHEYTHWLRDRRPTASLEAIGDIVDPRPYDDLKTILLSRALSQLSSDLRDTFLLYHAQALSVAEIAALLEVPVGTVKSRLFTARGRLRELLAEPPKDAQPVNPAPVPVA